MPETINQQVFLECGMRLTVMSCSTNESVPCELIGVRCGRYLVLRILKDKFAAEFHKEEERLIVSYACPCTKSIFRFSSQVIQAVDSPDKLFFIKFQRTVEDSNQRSDQRINCHVPVHLSSGEIAFNGTISNISTKGCLCVIDNSFGTHLEVDGRVSIRFSNRISINGKVCFNKRQFLHNHNVGICFTNIDDDSQENLIKLIPSLEGMI